MRRRIRLVAWGLAIGAAATASLAWATAGVGRPAARPTELRSLDESGLPGIPLDSTLSRATGNRNPFRIDQQTARPPRKPSADATGSAVAVRPPQPSLVLAGLLGPPWVAILEGIPGHETGALLAEGQVINGIRIVAVRGDTIRLANADTVWVLTQRKWAP